MDARELNSHVRYAGMERDARAILLKDNLATVETLKINLSDIAKPPNNGSLFH